MRFLQGISVRWGLHEPNTFFGGGLLSSKARLCRKKSVAKSGCFPRSSLLFNAGILHLAVSCHDFGLWIACEAMRSQQEAAEAEEAQVSDVPVDVNPSALATVSEPSQVPTKGKNWGNCVVQNYRYEFIVSKCVHTYIFITQIS